MVEKTTRRPRVFIASSSESLGLARAVQENLERDFETTVWDQDVFQLSQYPLEVLLDEVLTSNFAIFILAPEDVLEMRGDKHSVVRDNVIYELGLFTGGLGRNRVFLLAPRSAKSLHLPTDLLGLTIAPYDPERTDGNLIAALGTACNKIRRLITKLWGEAAEHQRIEKTGLFHEFIPAFPRLIDAARTIELYFIHSRRWREDNNDHILRFLGRSGTNLIIYLPDLDNKALMDSIRRHFDDGDFIPGFVGDAYRYFSTLFDSHPGRVSINLFSTYPTYSFYRFDCDIVVAMYPTTQLRKSPPTFQFSMNSPFGGFIASDLEILENSSRKPTRAELQEMINNSRNPI